MSIVAPSPLVFVLNRLGNKLMKVTPDCRALDFSSSNLYKREFKHKEVISPTVPYHNCDVSYEG